MLHRAVGSGGRRRKFLRLLPACTGSWSSRSAASAPPSFPRPVAWLCSREAVTVSFPARHNRNLVYRVEDHVHFGWLRKEGSKEEEEAKVDINVKVMGNQLLRSYSCLKTGGLGDSCVSPAVRRKPPFTPWCRKNRSGRVLDCHALEEHGAWFSHFPISLCFSIHYVKKRAASPQVCLGAGWFLFLFRTPLRGLQAGPHSAER